MTKSPRQKLINMGIKNIKSVRYIKKKLKELCSQIVRKRDGKCLRCGSTKRLQAHHIKSVGAHPYMRFDLDNMITLCYSCHIYWAHKDILDTADWLTKKLGYDKINLLKNRAMQRGYTKHYGDYMVLYKYLKENY